MAPIRSILYPTITYPPLPPNLQPETVTESRWHQPWSEPVRFKRGTPAYLQQAYTGDPTPFPVSRNMGWFNWWSEPVRKKPGIGAYLQRADQLQVPVVPPVSSFIPWFAPFSEPVRTKPSIRTGDQPFFSLEPEPPEAMEIPWYSPLSEPVRQKIGLKAWLQQTTAMPPRLLPTPNVTVIMAATETNSDVAEFAINVYTGGSTTIPGQGAQVSIEEIKIPGNSPVSNKGN